MLNDIFEEVAKKHNIPVEQVSQVYKSMTDSVRYYIANHLVSKTLIKIPHIGSFTMTPRSVRNNKNETEKTEDYFKQFKRKKNDKKA